MNEFLKHCNDYKIRKLRNDDEPQDMITHLLYYDLNDIAV